MKLEIIDTIGEIQSDRTRLRQIIYNLISNACKFTESGKVTLSTAYLNDSKDFFEIAVKDTGIGMTNEQVNKLFSHSLKQIALQRENMVVQVWDCLFLNSYLRLWAVL